MAPPNRARVTCVVNQKGGVGKTTTAVNLAASVAAAEKRTLLIDMDPQGNASSGCGVRSGTRERTVYDVLIGAVPLADVLVATEIAGLSVAPATQDLVAAELELVDDPKRAMKLKLAIEPLLSRFDHIFIDCPPSLGLLTVNALAAADAVLVPLQCEYYALEGLTHLMATIDRVKNGMNPGLEVEGVVLTMFDPRNNLAHQVAEEVKKHFFVFESVIPRNVRLSEAPSHGKPIILYDVSSKGAQGYLALARELLVKHSGPSKAGAKPKKVVGVRVVSAPQNDPKRRALGRGLDALLPAAREQAPNYGDKSVFSCALEKLVPQKGQPRQHFAKDKIEELAASIKEHGLLEPIVVRRVPGQDKFEIIAGERRWRASQKAGLREALVVVKDVSPKAAFELALIENVQREDLNPVELAEALDRLVKEHHYTQETLAERLGKDRTTVANSLRLLKLPPTVRARVISGVLSEGHARALLGAPDPSKIEEMAEKCVRGHLSVRAAEALVRGAKAKSSPKNKGKDGKTASHRDLELRLTRAAGTKVQVRDQGNKGEVVIPYEDLDHLDRILARVFKRVERASDDRHDPRWEKLAEQVRAEVREGVAAFVKEHGRAPGLEVVLVGEDPASQIYTRNKEKAALDTGIRGKLHVLPADTSEAALMEMLARLNMDEEVDGILVQLPLPKQIREQKVLDAIRPEKDVDGFHPVNAGLLASGRPSLVPCTPRGSMKLIALAGRKLEGARAVVVGRSNIVGKPMAQLLLAANATVTMAHSRTADLAAVCREADVLVVAVGKAELVRGDWVKPGAVVIDVGMNRIEMPGASAGETMKTKLVGDVAFDEAKNTAGFITPVPGGVGPMTIACLLENTLNAAQARMAGHNPAPMTTRVPPVTG